MFQNEPEKLEYVRYTEQPIVAQFEDEDIVYSKLGDRNQPRV
jgi:hypothetical protein